MKINRGQIWIVNFNPARGSEQAGVRPALIVQNDVGNEFSVNTIVLAISSTQSNFKLDVQVLVSNKNNLNNTSYVKCSQMLTISKDRLIKCLGSISPEELKEVDKMLRLSLNL